MVMSQCFQRRWVTFFAIVFVLTCYSEIVEGQQNWFKPAATTRRPIATAITSSKTKRFPEARKPAAVVFPEDGQGAEIPANKMHQEIPLSLLNQLNEATDWTEFLKYVDNVTVIEGDGDTPYVYGWDVDGRTKDPNGAERDASVPAKAAHCIPELQTVPLLPNSDSSVLFYPTCTRVERCGGCCSSDLLVCEPIKTEIVHFQVLKTQYAGGSRMKFAGKESVPVEKHTACKCQCKVKESHCTVNQEYVPGACRCECSNIDDRRKCESDNQTRYWDSRNCICRCRDNGVNSQCSTGFYFNEDVCKCTPWVFQRRDFDLGIDFEEEDSRQPVVIPQYNDIPVNRRPVVPPRPIYKEEDNYKEEEKKSRPVERFQFANNWNLQNSRPRQP
ncbi:uncharacterized protein LOC116925996 [Daphnia magna]|uniref:Platelet-derived growth factor (PDGF) family profile domain-containing protein n=1 Tax=Daphnia magna TaxID=35525 RepID=A0ABR0AJK8_9CRUS|nr:uncharacterized protein LOC116925996 [Daphnia magna]XP_032788649.2 uncharacterized protein LOC116925996 [Daphnia magna]KAK4025309.1 hypothetical protein OUZ56_014384 [Daphnia magna]